MLYLCQMDRVFQLQELDQVVAQLWEEGKNRPVWAFFAPMGAGKTTLISRLSKWLGIEDSVSSPTFSIINEYELPDGERVCHMDWYRLNGAAEAVQAGVEERIVSGDRCWIEWPERAAELLPDDTWFITLRAEDADTRHIKTGNQSFS